MTLFRTLKLISVLALLQGACAPRVETADDEKLVPDDSKKEPEVPTLRRQYLSETFLANIVRDLSSDEMAGRKPGSPQSEMAQAYILKIMSECGLEPAGEVGFLQPVYATQSGQLGVNLLAKIPGTDPLLKDRVIVINAHYDHLGIIGGQVMNGANDNAAAVAQILSVGCALKGMPLKRTVLIAAWDMEEPPYFNQQIMGSDYWVKNPTVPLKNVDVALTLDLVGGEFWKGYVSHLLIGAEHSPEVASAIDSTPIPANMNTMRGGEYLVHETLSHWSDYGPFWAAGIPYVFFSNGQNKFYHRPTDDFETIRIDHLALQAEYLSGIVLELASSDKTPTVDANREELLRDAKGLEKMLMAALETRELGNVTAAINAHLAKIRSAIALGADLDLPANHQPHKTNLARASTYIMCLAGNGVEDQTGIKAQSSVAQICQAQFGAR